MMETLLQVQEFRISGRLRFIDPEDCLVFDEEQGEIKLVELVKKWFDKFDGEKAVFSSKNGEEFHLKLDENSNQFLWQKHFLKSGYGKNSLKNLLVCLELCLGRINGRLIKVESGEDSLKIHPDLSEKVHEVLPERGYYVVRALSSEEVSEICQAGTNDCCVFLFLSPEVERRCAKFHPRLFQKALKRLESCSLRIGNCRLKEE